MAEIKICGIRRKEDIEFVNCYLPEFVGFVFAESKRRVSLSEAGALISNLSGNIKKVGVFVNVKPDEVFITAHLLKLDALQLHGDETPDYIGYLKRQLGCGTEIWKAIRVKDRSSLKGIGCCGADRIVLDTYSKNAYGGIGETFDWTRASGLEGKRLVLAGGLNAGNVEKAIKIVKPDIVDVSSGIETGGLKDAAKIKDFIGRVRSLAAGVDSISTQ